MKASPIKAGKWGVRADESSKKQFCANNTKNNKDTCCIQLKIKLTTFQHSPLILNQETFVHYFHQVLDPWKLSQSMLYQIHWYLSSHTNTSLPTPISSSRTDRTWTTGISWLLSISLLKYILPENNENFFNGYAILVCTTCTPHTDVSAG